MNYGLIPIIDSVVLWGDDDNISIVLKCPKCNTLFDYYRDKEKYCHNCGQKIDWEGYKRNGRT